MILHERYDISLSFVTNGTTFNPSLLAKLTKFARVGIEVSMESITKHNNYVRQGTDTKLVLSNLVKYAEVCNNTSITTTIRPAISALTIGYYHTLLSFCYENKILIKSLLVTTPEFLDVDVLPELVRSGYLPPYVELLKLVSDSEIGTSHNESDPHNFTSVIKQKTLEAIALLSKPTLKNQDTNLIRMVDHCKKWDSIYKLNAVELYPELTEVFDKYGY